MRKKDGVKKKIKAHLKEDISEYKEMMKEDKSFLKAMKSKKKRK